MSRYHFWSFLVNDEGQPIENANVSVFLAETDMPAQIYTQEHSGTYLKDVPQLKSLKNGYFEFWIPELNNPDFSYGSSQKFKIKWDKIGIEKGIIDNINIYPDTIPVNELDTNESKNKCVSNNLAFGWESHINNSSHIIHGINEIDLLDNTDVNLNKLVSNQLASKWDTHVDSTSFPLSGDSPHNLRNLDLTDNPVDEFEFNRVINFSQGKQWNEHSEKNYEDLPHGIEVVDETSSDTTVNKLVSNNLMRIAIEERSVKKIFTVFPYNWSLNENSEYEAIIQHNFDQHYLNVQLWNIDEQNVYVPQDIEILDENNILITNPENLHSKAIITG